MDVGAVIAQLVTAETNVTLLVAFVFGAISFVSPCVLPLLPGYLSLMSGYSVSQLERGEASTLRMLRVTGLFVLGFTLVFVAIGAAATSVGQLLRQYLNQATIVAGWVVIVFGVLIVISALADAGPLAALMRERRLDVKPSKLGAWAPPVMGVAFGFGWTPCIGPVLTAILATASVQETVVEGMALLAAYSLGLGVPFILSGLAMSKAMGAMRALRRHLRTINVASGVLLAAFGVLMVTGYLSVLSTWAIRFLERIGLDRLAAI